VLILPDHNRPYYIGHVNQPIVPQYFWNLSGSMLDFTLNPLVYLEEYQGPTILIEINGFRFSVPSGWHILIVDTETKLIDTIPVSQCSTSPYLAMIVSSISSKYMELPIKVVDFKPDELVVYPMISKGCMMFCPVGEEDSDPENIVSVLIGPYDLYDKYLENVSAKELFY